MAEVVILPGLEMAAATACDIKPFNNIVNRFSPSIIGLPIILLVVALILIVYAGLQMQGAVIKGRRLQNECGEQIFEGDTVRGMAHQLYVTDGTQNLVKGGAATLMVVLTLVFAFVTVLATFTLLYEVTDWGGFVPMVLAIIAFIGLSLAYGLTFGYIYTADQNVVAKYSVISKGPASLQTSRIIAKTIMYFTTYVILIGYLAYILWPRTTGDDANTLKCPIDYRIIIAILVIYTLTLTFHEFYSPQIEALGKQFNTEYEDYKTRLNAAVAASLNDPTYKDFYTAYLQRNIKRVDGDLSRTDPVVTDPKYTGRYYLYMEHGNKAPGSHDPKILAILKQMEQMERTPEERAGLPRVAPNPPVTENLEQLALKAWLLLGAILLAIMYAIMHIGYSYNPMITTYVSVIGMFVLLGLTATITWMSGSGLA